jgi:hypothetical protein
MARCIRRYTYRYAVATGHLSANINERLTSVAPGIIIVTAIVASNIAVRGEEGKYRRQKLVSKSGKSGGDGGAGGVWRRHRGSRCDRLAGGSRQ